MKIKYTRSNLLFLTAYVLWITVTLLKYTYIKDLLPIKDLLLYAKYIVYVLLILKFADDCIYQIRSFLGAAVVFFIGYIEYSVQDTTVNLFMLCIFIYSAANVDFDDILKVSLFVEIFVFAAAIGLCTAGVIPNGVWDEGVRHRYDLGFVYCTFGSHLMLFITMIYCCIRKKITLIESMVLAVLNIWLYYYNDTKTDIAIVIPFLICLYVWGRFSKGISGNLASRFLFQYCGVFSAVVAVAVQFFYNPAQQFYVQLNGLLSGRILLGNRAIEQYGFTLLGQRIRWIGQGSIRKNPALVYNYVDCSFLKYLLNYGIIFMILLLVGLMYIGKKAVESGELALCLSLLFLCVFAMVDAELCVLAFHPFLLKAGELLNPVTGGDIDANRKNHSFE